jgi:ferredoxin--NADP+ reductase
VANATIAWRDDLTATVARFGIRPDDGVPAFQAGQYAALSLVIGGRVVQRPYSAATASTAAAAPADAEVEFLIRLVTGGALTPALWRARPGDRVRLGRPKGLFLLTPDDARCHLLLATGTGVAPLVAMATVLRSRGPVPPRIVLIHGVREADELAYRDRLEAWARADPRIHYLPVVSGAGDWPGRRGRIDAALPSIVDELAVDPAGAVAYLCGSPGMIEGVSAVLGDLGLAPAAIRSERYWDPSPPRGR